MTANYLVPLRTRYGECVLLDSITGFSYGWHQSQIHRLLEGFTALMRTAELLSVMMHLCTSTSTGAIMILEQLSRVLLLLHNMSICICILRQNPPQKRSPPINPPPSLVSVSSQPETAAASHSKERRARPFN